MFIKITFLFLSIFKIIAFVKCSFEEANVLYYNIHDSLMNESYSPRKGFQISKAKNRLVIDLKSRMYIDEVVITNDDLRNTTVTGKCVDDIIVFDLLCPKLQNRKFVCDRVCRTISVEGVFGNFKMQLKGYDPFLDKALGCYAFNGTEGIDNNTYIEDCQSQCKSFHYFAIGVLKCICLNSFNQLSWKQIQFCNRPCLRKVLTQCGSVLFYSVYYAGSRNIWQMETPSIGCLYNSTDCPMCKPGRSGYECEIISCDTPNSCGDKMECERTDITAVNKNAFCGCRHEYATVFSDGITCEENVNCLVASCDIISSRCKYNGTDPYVCECKEGFEYHNHTFCKDIDECKRLPCNSRISQCGNLIGSYYCQCKLGYKRIDELTCEDIDECINKDICDRNTSICKNTPSTYVCLCRMGFIGESHTKCMDIDECETLEHYCFNNSVCINTFGSFLCQCPNYTLKYVYAYGVECEDVDECKYPDACNVSTSICVNVFGSYTCSCLPGLANVDDFKCDVDKTNVSITTEDQNSITTEAGALEWQLHQMLIVLGVAIIIASLCIGFVIVASKIVIKSERSSIRRESMASRNMAIRMEKFIKSETDSEVD